MQSANPVSMELATVNSLRDSTDLSDALRHRSRVDQEHASLRSLPFQPPIDEKTFGMIPWHYMKGGTSMAKIISVIFVLYISSIQQSKQQTDQQFLDLYNNKDGIAFRYCKDGVCTTKGAANGKCCAMSSGSTLARHSSHGTGKCSLPKDDPEPSPLCVMPSTAAALPTGSQLFPGTFYGSPNATSATSESKCFKHFPGEPLPTCCCGREGISMFLNCKTGTCERMFPEYNELIDALSVVFPLIVAVLMWSRVIVTIAKQDLFYRLLQHGFLLDFKDRNISMSMIKSGLMKRSGGIIGFKYLPFVILPLGMGFMGCT